MSSIKIKNKVTGNWEKLPTMKGKQGEKGNDGLGVPLGGTTGQILAKKSDTNNDTEWIDNNGSVVDTLNVENKITNAPSLRLFEENANEIEERLMVLDGNVVKNQNDITSLTDNKVNNSKQISIDLNTVTTTGFYYCNSCTNTPSGNGYLFSHRNSDKYMLHLFIPFGGGALYTRVRNNGTWNAWKEVMYKTGGTFTGKVAFNDTTTINAGLELSTATPYIDFHFGKSTNDYTSRILEISSGQLDFETPNGIRTRDIIPAVSTNYNLGSSGALWNTLYINTIRSTMHRLYSSGSASILGVADYFTIRDRDDINIHRAIAASAFTNMSSRRYKENIVEMTEDEANKLNEINIVKFDYKTKANGENQAGVIAEDVYEVLPNIVTMAEIDGEKVPDSVDYSKFVPYLIKKVQMLEKRVSELENKEEI